jgi:hypothetical protein
MVLWTEHTGLKAKALRSSLGCLTQCVEPSANLYTEVSIYLSRKRL